MSRFAITNKNPDISGEIDLTLDLSQQMGELLTIHEYSDVTFIIEGAKIPSHKNILAARSPYFRALLYGGLAESLQEEIELKVPLNAFKTLLNFMYTGCMSLAKMNKEDILDSLGLANQYGFESLKLAISTYLSSNLTLENCCAILDAVRLFELETLNDACIAFMGRNSTELLKSSTFRTLSQDSLCTILERDSFYAPEVQIFNAVKDWYKSNPSADIAAVVSFVRLPLMSLEELLEIERPCTILDSDHILDAIKQKTVSKGPRYRGILHPDKNVASVECDSKTIQGESPTALLNGEVQNYDGGNGYTHHIINDYRDQNIIVELGTISIINNIKLLLWDLDDRSYSYFIETSVNQDIWERVVDHTQYLCRSWQFLYFPSRVVRYIKLVGTHNTSHKQFHAVALEAYCTMKIPDLVNGLVSPSYNIATIEMGALVIKGTGNALLNGDIKNFSADSGYTSHKLGDGGIIIKLNQPYYIGSLRLLLWDIVPNAYGFYIETSVNQKDWIKIVDKQQEQLRSWQQFTFQSRPVVFIKIVGTSSTNNMDFRCVHFECPSQDLPKESIEAQ